MRRMHTDEEIKILAANVAASLIADLGISETEDGLEIDNDVEVTGDLKAKTLDQSEANITIEATPSLPDNVEIQSGRVPYVALKVINGVLWINAVISLTNTGASTWSGALTLFPSVAIPEGLAEKIYRADGTKVSEQYTGSNLICYLPAYQNGSAKSCVVGSYGRNSLNIYIDGASIGAGASVTYSIRGALTLI